MEMESPRIKTFGKLFISFKNPLDETIAPIGPKVVSLIKVLLLII